MYFILIFGVFTFGLIIERTMTLYLRLKEPGADFRQRIGKLLGVGDVQGAEAFAMANSENFAVGRIAEIGCQLRANAGGDEEIQARMDEALSAELSALDKRTGFLAMFGNVATLLGLLGTISGMIHSFAAVANASPVDRATMLSKGISEAMNCTAFGLVVAIPALVAFAVFQNRTDRIVTQITEMTSQIYHDLIFFVEGGRGANKAAAAKTASGKTVSSPGLSV